MDVRALIRRCQAVVKARFGVDLVTEVEMVGEWDDDDE
jgi:UDP-N-acetylenolpyruvoylglucosamine reductase